MNKRIPKRGYAAVQRDEIYFYDNGVRLKCK
jgi:hypothetical protein